MIHRLQRAAAVTLGLQNRCISRLYLAKMPVCILQELTLQFHILGIASYLRPLPLDLAKTKFE
ncbi:hypothetical protein AUI51_04015 [archaeon 13_1_40CM_2_52_4]|nr:MAG: hypothetical protein AUI51_04015 [archaeon 13_1_40CM_2_52_4]